LVDKPGRRKKPQRPWKKIAGVVIAGLVAIGAAYYVYENYIYQAPPLYAKVGTSLGYFYVELYPSCAPQTVANFVKLSDGGFYTNLAWHRVVNNAATPEFVIQTGDPNTRGWVNSTRSTWGKGGSNQTVPLEFCGTLHNYAGYLGMARGSDPNSGSSQWYVNLSNGSANLNLDPSYTVFGKVISGMKVVCSIGKVAVYGLSATQDNVSISDQPISPVFLSNVTMIGAASAPVPQPIAGCS
jgi:cyclophilin family peptidyl-prolyl cis-trans isomerase